MVRLVAVVCTLLLASACGSSEERSSPRSSSTASRSAPTDEGAAGGADHGAPPSPFVAVRAPSDDALLEAPARALGGDGSVEQIAASYPLRVVRVHAQPGDSVDAGAPLVEVTSAEVLGAAATYRGATESLRVAEARLATLRELREQRVASAEQVFELESRVATERGRQLEALAALRAAGLGPGEAGAALARGAIVLRSVRGGVVRALHATPGEVHPDGQTFGSVVTGSSRRIEARFPSPLDEGFRFEFEDLLGRRHPLGPRPTRTLEAGDEGGVLVWFDLPDAGDVAPDAPGHVHAIPVDARLVEVPVGALHPLDEAGGGAEVVRRRGTETRRVPVRVVASSGASAIVRGELAIGDDVASDAAATIEAGEGATP